MESPWSAFNNEIVSRITAENCIHSSFGITSSAYKNVSSQSLFLREDGEYRLHGLRDSVLPELMVFYLRKLTSRIHQHVHFDPFLHQMPQRPIDPIDDSLEEKLTTRK
jgi:hypothetical protein